MRRTWMRWVGTTLVATGFVSGCVTSSTSGSRPLAQTLTGTWQPSALSADANPSLNSASPAASAVEEAPQDPYGKLPQQAVATSAMSGSVVLASLKQAGSSLTESLRIQPKITEAADPVKLNNQPANSQKVGADLHYHAGYFFETQHKLPDAAAHYREALQTTPDDIRCLAAYGRVQDQLGNPTEAESYLRRACQLAPQDPAPLSDLAQCYARRQNWEAAIPCAQEAIRLQPANQGNRVRLAGILLDAGRETEAVQELASVHGEALAHYQIGCLLYERRATEAAKQHVQRSLELKPYFATAQQTLDRWQAAANRENTLAKQTIARNALPAPRRLPVAN